MIARSCRYVRDTGRRDGSVCDVADPDNSTGDRLQQQMSGTEGQSRFPPAPPEPYLPSSCGPPPAPSPPPHRWGLGAYLLAELVFLGASVLIGWLLFAEGSPTAGLLAVALAVPTMLAAATAVLITVLRGNGPFVDLRLHWSGRDLGLGLAFGFGGLFLTIPASAVYVAIVGEDASSAVGDIFARVQADVFTAVLIMGIVVFVAPLCEEVLYRGLLWGGLTRLGAGRWVAFAVTTIIFALAHFEWERAPLLLIVAIPIGLARVYTDGLLAPIVAHMANNLLPGVALLLMLLGAFPAV